MSELAESEKNDIPDGAIVVRSIVSSPLADRIAAHYGVEMKTVLTGLLALLLQKLSLLNIQRVKKHGLNLLKIQSEIKNLFSILQRFFYVRVC